MQDTVMFRIRNSIIAVIVVCLASIQMAQAQTDPLPSWAEGNVKASILDFVARAVTPGGSDYIPPEERIATFDNDGTLWAEQPNYAQFFFAIDRVRALAPQHPEWAGTEPFKSLLANDMKAFAATGLAGVEKVMMTTHAGMTVEEFDAIVKDWIATAHHPRFHRPYNELIYQPMLELMAYLRANEFKTYIVSGGGGEFIRAWAQTTYGIPPEQVIGSSIKLEYRLDGDKPTIRRLPETDFIDDGPGKPVGIAKFIGRRPVFAAGNSDGDLQMLQWTTIAPGNRLGIVVHHTDEAREYAYDRTSPVGKLDKALDEASKRGWLVIDMKNDWKTVFPTK